MVAFEQSSTYSYETKSRTVSSLFSDTDTDDKISLKSPMNSNNERMDDDESTSIDEDMREAGGQHPRSRTHTTRSSDGSTSSGGTTTNAPHNLKRQKEMPPCFVCGAKANGYNFDQSKSSEETLTFSSCEFPSSYVRVLQSILSSKCFETNGK